MIIKIRSSILGKLSTSDAIVFSSWYTAVSPLFEHHFKVRSGQLSSLQTSPVQRPLEIGINLRVNFPSVSLCMSQLRVPDKKVLPTSWRQSLKLCLFQSWLHAMRHLIFIQRQITEINFRNKLRVFFKNSIKFYINIT